MSEELLLLFLFSLTKFNSCLLQCHISDEVRSPRCRFYTNLINPKQCKSLQNLLLSSCG